MFYYDWTYILMLPGLLLGLWAQSKVNSAYQKYSRVAASSGIPAAQAAQALLLRNGNSKVKVEKVAGQLTDHYDPKVNVIRLSDEVYNSTSVAAIGVACHEAGHAVQYAQKYGPITLRAAIIPITNIGSKLAMPLILLGLLLELFGGISNVFVMAGVACFSLSLVFQLVTLPVEFNASRRAIAAISQGNILTDDELVGAKKTLRAAAMTYVAATAVALVQLLRLILIFSRRRND